MIYKSILKILFFLTTSYSYSQKIEGKVINKEDKSGISYVSIGIPNKSVGTVSDADGNFKLILTDEIKATDYIIFESVNYQSVKSDVLSIKNNGTVEMISEPELLEEIVINTKNGSEKKVGRKSTGLSLINYSFYSAYENDSVDDALSKETGMAFKLKKDSKINSLNFNISSNQYKLLKFRVNIYQIEDGVPNKSLFEDKDFIFTVENEYIGWYNVDLKDYGLYLDKEIGEIAVTIQWIESVKTTESSKFFSIPVSLTGGSHYIRNKAMDRWKKQKQSLSFYLEITEYDK